MEFFDCNCFIGLPTNAIPLPVPTAEELLAQMDRAGVGKALVWHVAQRDYSPPAGNRLLAEAIAPHRDRLVGCWSLLPPQTLELPRPEELLEQMASAGVKAVRVHPAQQRFLLRLESFGGLLGPIVHRRIPLLVSVGQDVGWEQAYDLLRDFPDLVCVLCDTGLWGPDRWFRPLIERYPNVYVETSQYAVDGGIEAFVERYGPDRMLYGSGMPLRDYGGMMLALRHAEIPQADRQAIAAGNLRRLLDQAQV